MSERSSFASSLLAATFLLALGAIFAAPSAQASATSEPLPCASICEPPPRVEPPDPQRSMLVIDVGWDTGSPTTSSEREPASLPNFVGYLSGHVNEWFRRSAPAGLFRDWLVAPGGSYEIAPPRFPSTDPSACDREQVFGEIAQRADAAARAHGLEPDAYARVVIHWSRGICGFGGIAQGRHIGLNELGGMPMHELGHSLGLNHANALHCVNAAGTPVPLSSNCSEEEYGDPYDLMGSTAASLSYGAVYTNQLHWLDGQFHSVAAGDFSRTFTIGSFTDPAHPLRAVRLADGATLWLEYRRPVGVDSPLFLGRSYIVEPGVVIHREAFGANASNPTSQLLDMTPSTATLTDARLSTGQTWANPLGEMTIQVVAESETSATISISSQRVRVPSVIDLTAKAASVAIGAAGLTYGGSTLQPETGCDHLNRVSSQTPAAGARVLPGTVVKVKVGIKDPNSPCL